MPDYCDASAVRELLDYDPSTGKLKWLERDPKWFADPKRAASWNARFAGKPAFTSKTGNGYFMGSMFGQIYLAHRVIYAWMTGEWPEAHIDHINRTKQDNRWSNLRPVTASQNHMNRDKSVRNTSGHTGVYWHKGAKKWMAYIKKNGAMKNLGVYLDKGDAIAARKNAEREYGFHESHGV